MGILVLPGRLLAFGLEDDRFPTPDRALALSTYISARTRERHIRLYAERHVVLYADSLWGYKRVWARLRRDGYAVNRKRIERLWREQGFQQPLRRPKKKRRSGETVPVCAEHANRVFNLRLHLRRHRHRQAPHGVAPF